MGSGGRGGPRGHKCPRDKTRSSFDFLHHEFFISVSGGDTDATRSTWTPVIGVTPWSPRAHPLWSRGPPLRTADFFLFNCFWEGHESCLSPALDPSHSSLGCNRSCRVVFFHISQSHIYLCCWLFMCMNILSSTQNSCSVYWFGVWTAMVVSFICICTCTSSLSDQLKSHTRPYPEKERSNRRSDRCRCSCRQIPPWFTPPHQSSLFLSSHCFSVSVYALGLSYILLGKKKLGFNYVYVFTKSCLL